ncbi:hypothetical protein HMPREF0004_0296 [Achromobacter piechaudii ATCC 43553]|uniref:Uncharacterized protein n=1 Tax=Achromobacter piechaudii ATCC 43553 TaxID=742159 RepID=D4X499_9BURK|nr:hypothetical protein HMPREF0004_0296 [Achromobacter piechaudii ATCC 43553]
MENAGYSPRLISSYLNYLAEFHDDGHPDQIWLRPQRSVRK